MLLAESGERFAFGSQSYAGSGMLRYTWRAEIVAAPESARMFRKLLLAVFICLMGAIPALAMDCPTTDYSEVAQRMTDAPTCDTAMQLLLACQLGSSVDVSLSQIVTDKCEPDFLPSLSAGARRAYETKAEACGKRFAGQSGTMYQSMRAICAAEVAHTYAGRAAKAKKH